MTIAQTAIRAGGGGSGQQAQAPIQSDSDQIVLSSQVFS